MPIALDLDRKPRASQTKKPCMTELYLHLRCALYVLVVSRGSGGERGSESRAAEDAGGDHPTRRPEEGEGGGARFAHHRPRTAEIVGT